MNGEVLWREEISAVMLRLRDLCQEHNLDFFAVVDMHDDGLAVAGLIKGDQCKPVMKVMACILGEIIDKNPPNMGYVNANDWRSLLRDLAEDEEA